MRSLKKLYSQADIGHITFTGGEPFLTQRYSELVLYCRMRKSSVSFITNGTKAAKEDYLSLIELGVDRFQLPYHSWNPEVHGEMTGSSDAWYRVVESLALLQNLGHNPTVTVVITKLNTLDLRKTLESIKNLGITQIMLARFNIGGRGIENSKKLTPTKGEFKEAFAAAQSFAQNNPKISLQSNVCIPRCLIEPRDYPLLRMVTCDPEAKGKPLTMDFAGNIRSCNHSPQVLGSVFDSPLERIVQSQGVKEWGDTKPEYCEDCSKWTECFGGCRAASQQMGLGLNHPDPILNFFSAPGVRRAP